MHRSMRELNIQPNGKRKLCMYPVCWIILSISVTTFATSCLPTTPREWLENRVAAAYVLPGNRIVFLSGESVEEATWNFSPHYRSLRVYPADPTDASQIYDEIDSEDSFEMEKQNHTCSTKHKVNPTCNDVHTMDFLRDIQTDKTSVLSTKGYWRTAWTHNQAVDLNSTVMVFKTMRLDHTFEEAYYEFQQLDALVMERLTASPYVIDMYGFCGLSVLTDFAGKDISYVVDHMPRKDRLHLARHLARGVADLHKSGIIHNDFNPANIAYSEKKGLPVLFDFNIAVLRDSHCPFVSKYPNPQWRAPEEQTLDNLLDEKVDIYGLGNIYFRFAVGESPWHGQGLRLSQEEKKSITRKKLNGTSMPPYELPERKRDEATMAMLDITKKCLAFHPNNRPSAFQVLSLLDAAIHNSTSHGRISSTPAVGKRASVEKQTATQAVSNRTMATHAISNRTVTASIGSSKKQLKQTGRKKHIRGSLEKGVEEAASLRGSLHTSTDPDGPHSATLRTHHTLKNASVVH